MDVSACTTRWIQKIVPLVIGDILHVPVALDGLVWGEDEAVACQFPIYPEPDGFKRFFDQFKALRTGSCRTRFVTRCAVSSRSTGTNSSLSRAT
jgi:hypothetical protein